MKEVKIRIEMTMMLFSRSCSQPFFLAVIVRDAAAACLTLRKERRKEVTNEGRKEGWVPFCSFLFLMNNKKGIKL
jgi:hypothetical protein